MVGSLRLFRLIYGYVVEVDCSLNNLTVCLCAEKMKTDDLSESQSDYTAVPDREGSDTGQYGDDSAQDSSVNSRDTAAEELVGFVGMDCGDGSES